MRKNSFGASVRIAMMALMLSSASACAKVEVDTDFDKIRLSKHAIDVQSLTISLDPQRPNEETVGRLTYRGGLFLRSRDKRFGGLSGLLVSADGARMLAISDAGYWVTAQLDYKNGRLSGLRKAALAPMLDRSGAPLREKGSADAEGIAAATENGLDGDVYVSFERDHRIWVYPFGKDGFAALPSGEIPLPSDMPRLTVNGGIEGLVPLDADTIFTIAEDVRDRRGDLTGWLLRRGTEDGKGQDVLFWRAIRDFRVTDMAALPDGDILVLERSFSLERGAGMQLRRIARSAVAPLAALDGEILATLDVRYSIDNMEGLAVRKGENGETLIYVLSDDNFNGLQRTVLLMFALNPAQTTNAAASLQ